MRWKGSEPSCLQAMQVASLDWLPSQTSPAFFHHLNLCYTSHLFKRSFFSPSCLWLKSHSVTLRQSLENSRSPGRGVMVLQQQSSLGKNHHRSWVQWAISHLTKLQLDFSHHHQQKNVFRAPGKLKALFAVVRCSIRVDYGGSLDVYP